jgi:hypothetical protein
MQENREVFKQTKSRKGKMGEKRRIQEEHVHRRAGGYDTRGEKKIPSEDGSQVTLKENVSLSRMDQLSLTRRRTAVPPHTMARGRCRARERGAVPDTRAAACSRDTGLSVRTPPALSLDTTYPYAHVCTFTYARTYETYTHAGTYTHR